MEVHEIHNNMKKNNILEKGQKVQQERENLRIIMIKMIESITVVRINILEMVMASNRKDKIIVLILQEKV